MRFLGLKMSVLPPPLSSKHAPSDSSFCCWGADGPARLKVAPKKIKHVPFLFKYLELQRLMFYHNNALTSSHPYASQPISWPFLLRGVSFWTKGDEIRQQIYLLGNPIGWWLAVGSLSVLTGILFADQLTRRRGLETIEERTNPISHFPCSPVGFYMPAADFCTSGPVQIIQFDGILLLGLGSTLFRFLPHGPSTLPPPLSPGPLGIVPRHWRSRPIPFLPRFRWSSIPWRRRPSCRH